MDSRPSIMNSLLHGSLFHCHLWRCPKRSAVDPVPHTRQLARIAMQDWQDMPKQDLEVRLSFALLHKFLTATEQ